LKIKVGTNTSAHPLKLIIFYPTAKCHTYVLHHYSRSIIFQLKAHVSHGLTLLMGTRFIYLSLPHSYTAKSIKSLCI